MGPIIFICIFDSGSFRVSHHFQLDFEILDPMQLHITKPCTVNIGRRSCSAFAKPRIGNTWTTLLLVAECMLLSLEWSPDHLAPMAQMHTYLYPKYRQIYWNQVPP